MVKTKGKWRLSDQKAGIPLMILFRGIEISFQMAISVAFA